MNRRATACGLVVSVTWAAALAIRSDFAATAERGLERNAPPPIEPKAYAQNVQRSPNSVPPNERGNANAIIESTNVPITFWGRVVDQDGAPIDGAEIHFNYSTEHGNVAAVPWSESRVHKAMTSSNASGLFVIDGIKGSGLTIEDIHKAGHTCLRNESHGFDYAGITPAGRFKADPNKPVRFVVVSTAAANQISSFGGSLGEIVAIPADGTPVRWSWRTGKPAPDGELQITFRRDPPTLSRAGDPCTWSAAIEVIGGGIVEAVGSGDPHMAPAEGYAQAVEYRQAEQKRGVGARSFYIKTADGKYGRIELELYARDQGSAGRCLIRGAINPSGSRLVVNVATDTIK